MCPGTAMYSTEMEKLWIWAAGGRCLGTSVGAGSQEPRLCPTKLGHFPTDPVEHRRVLKLGLSFPDITGYTVGNSQGAGEEGAGRKAS